MPQSLLHLFSCTFRRFSKHLFISLCFYSHYLLTEIQNCFWESVVMLFEANGKCVIDLNKSDNICWTCTTIGQIIIQSFNAPFSLTSTTTWQTARLSKQGQGTNRSRILTLNVLLMIFLRKTFQLPYFICSNFSLCFQDI